jgi:hypothetical protein
LEEAETKIREIVKNNYLSLVPKAIIDEKVKRIIAQALKEIKSDILRQNARISLANFYNRQYAEIRRLTPIKTGFLYALMTLQGEKQTSLKSPILPPKLSKEKARLFLEEHGVKHENLYGVALQKYSKNYFDKDIKPVLDNLIKQYPIDPEDIVERMSLRAKAELEVRYQHNLDMVQNLKDEGHKLVICSTHADCSDRCAPWQGRVYSLDGTSGTTDDGRKYVPLEEATDQYYTTKKGKTYKNGLLGFNCRHFLVPYKSGYRFPKPDAKEERKQYEITKKQRQLERNVIKWKTEALEYKGINKDKYEHAKKKANEWNNAYIEYSKANHRAYYPSRTRIL